MRNGKYKIKRYKTHHSKWVIFLLLAAFLGVLLYFYTRHAPALPSAAQPVTDPADTRHETRVITLPAGQWFALQLGAFEEEKSAQALATNYRSRGAAGYIHRQDTCRVLAAAYEDRESARAVQAQLAQKHGVDAYLYPMARSEVTLRLSGQKAQLDALEDAFSLCDQLTYSFASLSQALDKGEISAREAQEALRSQQDTIRAVNSRMLTLFANSEHPAVQRLSWLLQGTQDQVALAIQSPDTARLGSSIKYCHLYLLCGLESYVQSLSP